MGHRADGGLLKQEGAWTYGVLANHIWGSGGVSSRPIQQHLPAALHLPHHQGCLDLWLNTESTYDWKNKQWSVPINLTVSKLLKFGNQPVSIGGGLRYWADSPDNGPHDWGVRLIVTFLFPK